MLVKMHTLIKMFKLSFLLLVTAGALVAEDNPAVKQLPDFKKKHSEGPVGTLTTCAGAPVEYGDAKSSLNKTLLENDYLIETLTEFVRERTPERPVHAIGSGAFGHFVATHDISNICKAKLFKVGTKTEAACRFSMGLSNGDPARGLRGMAVKFKTEEGNFDMVGFNTPFFPFKDPLYFAQISHVVRRNPTTNLYDPNQFWDWFTSEPEILLITLYLFSNIATPRGYHHMPGYGIFTFEVYNESGVKSYVRWHWKCLLGVKNFNCTEASKLDADFYTRDLYNRIYKGEHGKWELGIQVMTQEDVDNATFDIHDPTIEIPQDLFPVQPVGVLTLDKNPVNYQAEMEHIAFCPSNLVPGILGSPTKLFEARRLAYKNSQLYRLGSNFNKIPVNAPLKSFTYIRNGMPPLGDNGKDMPNYFPNTFNGPAPYVDENRPALSKITEKEPDNFGTAAKYYTNLSSKEKKCLINTIVKTLCLCEENIIQRAVKEFTKVHENLGERLTETLEANNCFNKS